MIRRITTLALTATLLIPLSASASLFGNVSNILGGSASSGSNNGYATSSSSSSLGRTCSQETASLYVNTCKSVWNNSNSSLATNQIPTASGSVHELSVCYTRNVCECISAYVNTGTISNSNVESCNAAVGDAYFSKIQTKKVAASKAAAAASSFFSGLSSLATGAI